MFRLFLQCRSYSTNQNPFIRTWNVLSKEVPAFFGSNKQQTSYPEHADIVIIGGGFIGSSVAYWLKTRAGQGLSVIVLEKDLSYKETQKNVTFGTITRHFSLPENFYLSQYSVEFLRNFKENVSRDVDIQYCPNGYLVLASEKYAEKLEQNVAIQREFGIKNELLTTDTIRTRFPWINTKDISLGCLGSESEGLFNSWSLLQGLIQKSQQLGAIYVNAEVTGFEMERQKDLLMEGVAPGSFERINKVVYKTPDNEEHTIKFAACILAAGDKSEQIARLAKVGSGAGLLKIPLPIEQRKYNVYSIEDTTKLIGLDTPFIMDTSGLWLKCNALENNLLCGHVPLFSVDVKSLPDDEYYNNIIKPSLLNRVPGFESAKVNTVGTEIYDCNTFDDTGILGPHPYHNNLYIAAGFGKYGYQNCPAIGRAITELIIDGQYTTIDLTRLGFDRILTSQPLIEFNIY